MSTIQINFIKHLEEKIYTMKQSTLQNKTSDPETVQ